MKYIIFLAAVIYLWGLIPESKQEILVAEGSNIAGSFRKMVNTVTKNEKMTEIQSKPKKCPVNTRVIFPLCPECADGQISCLELQLPNNPQCAAQWQKRWGSWVTTGGNCKNE